MSNNIRNFWILIKYAVMIIL